MSPLKRMSLAALVCVPVVAAACGSSATKPHTSSTRLAAPRKTDQAKRNTVRAHQTASAVSAKKTATP